MWCSFALSQRYSPDAWASYLWRLVKRASG